jgi:hypothetical protein
MRGLGWVRNPGEKTALWKSLIQVTKEIKDLEPVLLQPDTKVLLEKPSENIVTREKTAPDGTRYVIAYNQSIAESPARFILQSPAQSITVRRNAAKIEIKNATTFEDHFAGYEAKVYEIH